MAIARLTIEGGNHRAGLSIVPIACLTIGMQTRTTSLDELLAHSRFRRTLPDPALRRLLRERAGLSQDDVASVLGVSRPAITRWETGKRTPRGPLLTQYVELLDRLAAER